MSSSSANPKPSPVRPEESAKLSAQETHARQILGRYALEAKTFMTVSSVPLTNGQSTSEVLTFIPPNYNFAKVSVEFNQICEDFRQSMVMARFAAVMSRGMGQERQSQSFLLAILGDSFLNIQDHKTQSSLSTLAQKEGWTVIDHEGVRKWEPPVEKQPSEEGKS